MVHRGLTDRSESFSTPEKVRPACYCSFLAAVFPLKLSAIQLFAMVLLLPVSQHLGLFPGPENPWYGIAAPGQDILTLSPSTHLFLTGFPSLN